MGDVRKYTHWTDERRKKFLRELARTGNVTAAARKIGSSRSRACQLQRDDKEFRKLCKRALKEAADNLEREAFRRAVEGVEEPVFFMGTQVDTVRKYSDSLLTLLLKHTKRSKYMDRTETTLKGGIDVRRKATELSDEELQLIALRGRDKVPDVGGSGGTD